MSVYYETKPTAEFLRERFRGYRFAIVREGEPNREVCASRLTEKFLLAASEPEVIALHVKRRGRETRTIGYGH